MCILLNYIYLYAIHQKIQFRNSPTVHCMVLHNTWIDIYIYSHEQLVNSIGRPHVGGDATAARGVGAA